MGSRYWTRLWWLRSSSSSMRMPVARRMSTTAQVQNARSSSSPRSRRFPVCGSSAQIRPVVSGAREPIRSPPATVRRSSTRRSAPGQDPTEAGRGAEAGVQHQGGRPRPKRDRRPPERRGARPRAPVPPGTSRALVVLPLSAPLLRHTQGPGGGAGRKRPGVHDVQTCPVYPGAVEGEADRTVGRGARIHAEQDLPGAVRGKGAVRNEHERPVRGDDSRQHAGVRWPPRGVGPVRGLAHDHPGPDRVRGGTGDRSHRQTAQPGLAFGPAGRGTAASRPLGTRKDHFFRHGRPFRRSGSHGSTPADRCPDPAVGEPTRRGGRPYDEGTVPVA